MSEGKILIIDENKTNREFLQYYFAEKFHKLNYAINILTAGNSFDAIEILKKLKNQNQIIKAILMNIKISKVNDVELWKKIKIDIDRNIPILFYSNDIENLSKENYLNYAYNMNGDSLYELDIKLEKAVRHYDLMNENYLHFDDDIKNFSVKEPTYTKISKFSNELIEEILNRYIGDPEKFLTNLNDNVSFLDKVKVIGEDLNIENINKTDEYKCSKLVCSGLIKKHKYNVYNLLNNGGIAIFVLPFSGIGLQKIFDYKLELNRVGFIVEEIFETIDKKTIFVVRKPIIIEDENSDLILIEALNDKHMRDYYYVTREYFDMLTREIDMSFDQVSSHLIVYRREDMLPLSTVRIVPNNRIKLPIEYGLLDNEENFQINEKNCVEISHLAKISDDIVKEKNVNLRNFGDALKILFSGVLKYCIHNKFLKLYLSFDENNKSLEKLYSKLGFKTENVKIHYEGYSEKYIVMSLNIEEEIKNIYKTNNKFQLAIINSIIKEPMKIFISLHDNMFEEVISYQKFYKYIVELLEDIDYENYKKNIKLKLLDFPLTTGNMTKLLIKKYEIIGADISEYSFEVAMRKIKELDIKYEFTKLKVDINKGIPIENNSVDRIISLNLLYAIENPKMALSEFYRILKNEGYIILTNLNRNVLLPKDEFLNKIKEKYSEEEYKNIEFWKDLNDLFNFTSSIYYENYFDKTELKNLFEDIGFKVKKYQDIFLNNAVLILAQK